MGSFGVEGLRRWGFSGQAAPLACPVCRLEAQPPLADPRCTRCGADLSLLLGVHDQAIAARAELYAAAAAGDTVGALAHLDAIAQLTGPSDELAVLRRLLRAGTVPAEVLADLAPAPRDEAEALAAFAPPAQPLLPAADPARDAFAALLPAADDAADDATADADAVEAEAPPADEPPAADPPAADPLAADPEIALLPPPEPTPAQAPVVAAAVAEAEAEAAPAPGGFMTWVGANRWWLLLWLIVAGFIAGWGYSLGAMMGRLGP